MYPRPLNFLWQQEHYLQTVHKTNRLTVGFCGQYVTINTIGRKAAHVVNMLCCDLEREADAVPVATFTLTATDNGYTLSRHSENSLLYCGHCGYDLAYSLCNAILYQCIADNKAGMAIHAAAIASAGGGVLLPGKSGSGKSTLTTWLVSCGCQYLSDELIMLTGEDNTLSPYIRPFFLKKGSAAVLSTLADIPPEKIISGDHGLVVPHRLLNTNYSAVRPPLTLILFPEYKKGATTELTPWTGAQGCAALMECFVNARNLKNHGIGRLAALTRTIPVYHLSYGSFEGLYPLLFQSFPKLFPSSI